MQKTDSKKPLYFAAFLKSLNSILCSISSRACPYVMDFCFDAKSVFGPKRDPWQVRDDQG